MPDTFVLYHPWDDKSSITWGYRRYFLDGLYQVVGMETIWVFHQNTPVGTYITWEKV